MSYLIRSFALNVSKLSHTSLRFRNEFLLRSNPNIACLTSCNVQTRARRTENLAVDQRIEQLDNDARKQGRLSYNDVRTVFEIMKAKRAASVTQSLMIIRCCGSLMIEEPPEKRTKLVQEMWKALESLGVNLDISHYNALLRVYLENEYDFTPSEILADLEKRGLEPNRVTYQRLITRYCQKGDITGAMRILEFMREKEMPVNVTVFNALILGHSQAKDMVSAEGILNVMKQANIEPTGESYTQLICGFIKEGNIEKAKDVLQSCESHDIIFTDKEYFDIIFSLAKHGFENEVNQLVTKLRRVPGYNQEAMNSVFRLLGIGATETAFKILKTLVRSTRSDGSQLPLGSFFIAHLIRANFPPETVLKYCQELMKENLNQYALNVALDNSLRYQKEDVALFLLKSAKESGMIIRPHFFWPLLVLHGKKNDVAGMLNILTMMQKDFDLSVNTETIREFVVPYLLNKDSNIEALLMDLKACGCSIASGVSAVVYNHLMSNDIQKAATVSETYNSFYAPFIFRRPIVNAFINSGDIPSFVKLIRAVCAGVHWRATAVAESEKVEDDEEPIIPDYRTTAGFIVIDATKELMKDLQFIPKLQSILMELLNQGLGLTSKDALYIQQILQNQLTPQISELLEKLTSEELAAPPSKSKSSRISMAFLDETSLERLFESMKANGEPVQGVQKQLYLVYARTKNLEKLLKLKEEMDAGNFVFTTGMKAVLIDLYVEEKKLDEALQLYNATAQELPDFNLHPSKLLRLALLLVENDNIEKALEILNKKSEAESKESIEDLSFMKSSLCFRILNIFAEKGDVDRVNEFFNLFIDRELTEVNNILLGPLIKVHVTRGDMDAAMKTFEMCCERYKCTPWKHELARHFIEKEDAANLQKLTDLSTPIHGEVNSLYDLMLSFLESGRIRQAKKILETPGLRLRHDRIHNACNKYSNEGSLEHLENLLVVTKDINSVNRSELYYSMLRIQEHSADPQKALGIWMQMQEEDVQPSDQFLCLLADILKRHNIEVPFTVPNVQLADNESAPRDKLRVGRNSQTLRRHLNDENVDLAIELKRKIGGVKLNKTDWSLLIAACARQNRYRDALQLFDEFHKQANDFPHAKYFKTLLRKAAENGDVEFFDSWKSLVPENVRRLTAFETNRLRAFSNAGKVDNYLNELEERLNQVKNIDDFQVFEKHFPKGGLLTLLDAKPEHLPRVQAITKKCEEKGYQSSIMNNFWWIYLMQTNQIDAATKLWNEKIKSNPSHVHFGSLTIHIQRKNDPELGKAFVAMARSKVNVSPGILGVAYGTLISVFTQRNEINEAVECLKEAVEECQVPPSLIIRSSLILLKSACENKNIPFPYDIPVSNERYRQKREEHSESDSD